MTPEAGVSAFAPATVGNVICGFDVFGLALDAPGDRVTVQRRSQHGVVISRIDGDDGRLPVDPAKNVASVAIQALLDRTGRDDGIDVVVAKGLPLSGGMGGSAASSVAAAVAADALLGTGLSHSGLLECALAGEGAASGAAHMDNVAPALFGGLLLVRSSGSPPIVRLPVPSGLSVALLHPRIEMSTREGRTALGTAVSLPDAVAQWGNTAAFVHALHTEDWDLMRDALEDRIAEPWRSPSIPSFSAVREAALGADAVGCGISGAGPSIVALCRSLESAKSVGSAMLSAFEAHSPPPATLHISSVAEEGARIVQTAGKGVS